MNWYEPHPASVPPDAPTGYVFWSNFGKRLWDGSTAPLTRADIVSHVSERFGIPEGDVWVEPFEPKEFGDLVRWAAYVKRRHVGIVNGHKAFIREALTVLAKHLDEK